MARTINTHQEDSHIELLNWIRDQIDSAWRNVDRIRAKNDPNDTHLLEFYMNRLVRLEGVLNHLQYN